MSERARKMYEEEFGAAKLDEQQRLAKQFWPCCGEHRGGPHHEACAKYVEPEPEVHEDQMGLE